MGRVRVQLIVLPAILLLISIPIAWSLNIRVSADTLNPAGLPAPFLHGIDNADGDGEFTIRWSPVSGADEYILKEGVDGAEDSRIYRGPNLSFYRSNLSDGEYCYRVRAIILQGEWGPWSETRCTVVGHLPTPTLEPYPSKPTSTPLPTPTSTPIPQDVFLPFISNSAIFPNQLQCMFEVVGEVGDSEYGPRLYRHTMTYLKEKDIVVITGGVTYVGSVNKIRDEIYVYDAKTKKLSLAGRMISPRRGHIAIPIDNTRIRISGGSDFDEIIEIQEDSGKYRALTSTRTLITPQSIVNMKTIDSKRALLITYEERLYQAWIYHIEKNQLEYIGDFDSSALFDRDPIWQMEESSDKFLLTAEENGVIININTKDITSFNFPDLEDCNGFASCNYRRPEIIPLNGDSLLWINGWIDFDDGNEYTSDPVNATNHAYIYYNNKFKRIVNTQFELSDRLSLRTSNGQVILIGGRDNSFDNQFGTEYFEPSTVGFRIINNPHSIYHNFGAAVTLGNEQFLISSGLVELVTCK
jgi:hypothetical protein